MCGRMCQHEQPFPPRLMLAADDPLTPFEMDRRQLGSQPTGHGRHCLHLASIYGFDQRSRLRKWRYSVPAPTAARLAMSSRLASAPKRVHGSFATSKIRSRFCNASERSFQGCCEYFLVIKTATGGCLRLSFDRRHAPLYRGRKTRQ